MDRDDPSRSRGFGFVKFEKEADMKAAIEVRGARLAPRLNPNTCDHARARGRTC